MRRWADARACEAAAIARHGAVDLAVVPSTICRQCTRVVGECAGSRLAALLILVWFLVLGCGLDPYVARIALSRRILFDLHGVDGRDRDRCRTRGSEKNRHASQILKSAETAPRL